MNSQESGVVPFTIYRSTAAVLVHGKFTHHQARFGQVCMRSRESREAVRANGCMHVAMRH